jgi:hypothetical protein
MNQKAQEVLERGKPWVEVAESEDPQAIKTRAYEEIARVIIEARDADPSLTYDEIGGFYGHGRGWPSAIEKWHLSSAQNKGLPFKRGEAQRRYVERKAPTQHQDKVEMAKELLDDPKVLREIVSEPTKNKTARKVRNAVTAMNAKERKQAIEREQQKAKDRAVPLPAILIALVVKMREWALDMSGVYEDVVAIPGDHPQRAEVGRAASDLRHQAQRWELALAGEDEEVCPVCGGDGKVRSKALAEVVELPVIEGRAHTSGRR